MSTASQSSEDESVSSIFLRTGTDRILLRSSNPTKRAEEIARGTISRREDGVTEESIAKAEKYLRTYLSSKPAPLLSVPAIDGFVTELLGRDIRPPVRIHFLDTLREGKIKYVQTSAGRITIDLWVEGYLQNQEEVERYCRHVNKVLKIIKSKKERSLQLDCPQFGNRSLSCAYNITQWSYPKDKCNANGVCGKCDFKFSELI